ncbi:MAG: LytTR family DNA-binding domain-containing protein [Spirochaetaceae bacterium]|nr:LytTR family DNA-binding domain-containing protein [Spirochaetaceae bacterium]
MSLRETMRFVYREMMDVRMVAVSWTLAGTFVVLVTIIAPFGTDSVPVPVRLAHWGLCAVLGWPVCYGTTAAALYIVRSWPAFSAALGLVMTVLVLAACCTAMMHTLGELIAPDPFSVGLHERYLMAIVAILGGQVLLCYVACMQAAQKLVERRRPEAVPGSGPASVGTDANRAPNGGAAESSQPDPAVAELGDGAQSPSGTRGSNERRDRFHDRLSAEVGRDIVYLKVDGHYIDVMTTTGSAVVMMSLTDAVADLGDLGMQVHRSYWIAHEHVRDTVRRDNRTMLRLTGGHRVPVSNTYLPAVRVRHMRRDGRSRARS